MCDIARGRALNCTNYKGGVKRLLFINDLSLTDLTLSATEEVEAITGSPNAYEFLMDNGQSGATSTLTSDRVAGTTFYAHEITMIMPGLTKQDRLTIQNMAAGRPRVIVEDFNGVYLLFGIERGLSATTGTIGTGTASGDTNGYTISLTGEEAKDAYFVDADVITNDLTLVQGTQGS